MRAYALLALGTVAAVVAIQQQSRAEIRDAEIQSCERGNVIRLANWREATEEAGREFALYRAHDGQIARIHYAAYEQARARARHYIGSAKASGYQTGAGLPTIVCTEAYARSSWWPL